jgi:hypothetical protein
LPKRFGTRLNWQSKNGETQVANYAEYFARIAYKPKYHIGDRVIGTWNKIPFVGTVGNDTLVSEEEGARISVHLDLPIKFEDELKSVIICTHKQVRKLPEIK